MRPKMCPHLDGVRFKPEKSQVVQKKNMKKENPLHQIEKAKGNNLEVFSKQEKPLLTMGYELVFQKRHFSAGRREALW